jgi:UDP-glucose 4-epimerase
LEWSLKNNQSDIFNLGSGDGYSVLEVLNQSIKTLSIDIPNEMSGRREGDPAQLYANTTKVNQVLKWAPKYSLDNMIKTEYDFRKSNKNE